MRLERRATVARAGQCRYTARCRPALDPADCGRGAEDEHPPLPVCSRRLRQGGDPARGLRSFEYPFAIRATSPLLSKQPESDLRAFGNPLLFRFTSTENRSRTHGVTVALTVDCITDWDWKGYLGISSSFFGRRIPSNVSHS